MAQRWGMAHRWRPQSFGKDIQIKILLQLLLLSKQPIIYLVNCRYLL